MTATLSPRDLLNAYCDNARLCATAKDYPQLRAAFPGLILAATGMVYLRGKKLMLQQLDQAAMALTPEAFTEMLMEEDSSIVVADPDTFTRLVVLGEGMPDDDYGTLSKRLRIVRGLPRSAKLPVLTEALAYRYWLQEEKDETQLADWLSAFKITAPSASLQMKALIRLAQTGDRPETLKYPLKANAMGSLEHRILHNANWSGISTDCSVYQMLENANTKADELRLLDPALLEMHTIDGQACKLTIMEVDEQCFTASVTAPFKLKEGGKVRITDGVYFAPVKLSRLHYDGGMLRAEFGRPSARGNGPGILERAVTQGAPLYVLEEPIETFNKAPENKRWLGGEMAAVRSRTVPMDVLLAGSGVQ